MDLHPLDTIRGKILDGDKAGALALLRAHLKSSPYAYSWLLFSSASTAGKAAGAFVQWQPLVGDDPFALSLYLVCAREYLRQGSTNPAQLSEAKKVLEAAVRTPLVGGVDALQLLEEGVLPTMVSAGLLTAGQAASQLAESKGAFFDSQRVLLSEGEWPMRVRTGATEALVGRDADDEDESERRRLWSVLLQRMFNTYIRNVERRDAEDRSAAAKKWALKAAHQLRRIQLAMKQALDQCPKSDPLAVHYIMYVASASGSIATAKEALQQILSRTGTNLSSSPALLALQVGMEHCATVHDLFDNISRHTTSAITTPCTTSVTSRSQQGFAVQQFDAKNDLKVKKAFRDVGKQQDRIFDNLSTDASDKSTTVDWSAVGAEMRRFYTSWMQLEHGQLVSTQLATEVGKRATQRMLKVLAREEEGQAFMSPEDENRSGDETPVVGTKRVRDTPGVYADVSHGAGPPTVYTAAQLFGAEVKLHSALGDTIRAKDTAASASQALLGSNYRGTASSRFDEAKSRNVPMGLADSLFRQQILTERRAGIDTASTFFAQSLYRRGGLFGQQHSLNKNTSVVHLEAKFRPVGGMALYPLAQGKALVWGRILEDGAAMDDRFADDSGQWLRPEILLKRRRIEPITLGTDSCCNLTAPCGCAAQWVPMTELPPNPIENRMKSTDQGVDFCAPRAMKGTVAHDLVVDKRTILRLRRECDRRGMEQGRDKAAYNDQFIKNLPGSLFRVAQAVPSDTTGVGFAANVSVLWLLDDITKRVLNLQEKVPKITKANPDAALGAFASTQGR